MNQYLIACIRVNHIIAGKVGTSILGQHDPAPQNIVSGSNFNSPKGDCSDCSNSLRGNDRAGRIALGVSPFSFAHGF